MFLKIKHFVIFITIYFFVSCADSLQIPNKIEAKKISVDLQIEGSDSIKTFITPYRERINTILDSTLAYVSSDLVKDDGQLNTSAGNFLADLVLEQANPIFESRKGKSIDFVVLNHGGIRAIVSKGSVNARTAYQVMPFENYIVVVEMDGNAVRDLLTFLAKSGRAHPISNMELVLDEAGNYTKIMINGQPFDENKTYYVASNDYLIQGGDEMGFFKSRTSVTNTDYLVRNAIIDYFKKMDTITSTVDNRFIQLN
ncbi:5'-nucleotidase C-terminal domain-containing protein [Croceitalea rosinachiae]|uniref:5'-nucleotidase C-terminal domain-containing protein n=1 Tax=Croceitalea rosinachiae TaxID=3075596 RepID=A0ABU3AAR1_9FLAO|nr:5'-nucleotidase C-terminal domain-containing protein [Croceitalea sp. F388]MDT0607269.1 5'-nucleotidase C-terminal domain-containing protein [Croceitalea sp. F388]